MRVRVVRAGALGGGTPDPDRWRALSVTLAAGFMILLDVTIRLYTFNESRPLAVSSATQVGPKRLSLRPPLP